jgi:hypothetical protein
VGVVGRGAASGVEGTGSGTGSAGVVGTGTANGVRGTGNFGVVGTGSGASSVGVGGEASSVGVGSVGVFAGVVGGNRASGGMGVLGVSGPISGGFIPFAGRFDGGVRINGSLTVFGSLFVSGTTKSSVVPHPDGSQRVMHAFETPECWFEDVGRAQLQDGVARVGIDPDFAAVSGIRDDYHVFLTAEGRSTGLYITDRTSTGFGVREHGEGTSRISFSYRIMTRRAGTGRLDRFEQPSETGERTTAEPAERPVVSSTAEPAELPAVPSPASPEEREDAAATGLVPEFEHP